MEYFQTVIEIVALLGGIATVFGILLCPMFYIGSKIDALEHNLRFEIAGVRVELHQFKDEMHAETKDFHGRICVIEEKKRNE